MKKLLALVLALVMTLSLAVVGSNAAFKDAKDVNETYSEAVDVLSGMGVFNGYKNADGTYSFQPKGDITRAEVAAIVYRLYTADVTDKQASLYATYNKFSDMNGAAWAAGYIGYCANAGLIKGYDAKTFGPADKVTGYQALAMILRAVGYDKNDEFTGAQWQLRVASTAQQLGILKNVKSVDLNAAACRELVAELLFRTAAEVPTVTYTAALGYSNMSALIGGTKNATLGYKNFGLTKNASAQDEFGRPYYTWTNGKTGTLKVTYATVKATPVVTYVTAQTECQIAEDTAQADKEVTYTMYTNGVDNATKVVVNKLDTVTKIGAQGQLVEVYDNVIVAIDTLLAKVNKVSAATYDAVGHLRTEAALTLEVYDVAATTDVTVLNGETAWGYAKGDYVLVYAVQDSSKKVVTTAAKQHVEVLNAATSIEGNQTNVWVNANQHTVSGTTYSDNNRYLLNDAATDSAKNYTWFFDNNGNLIGSAKIAASYNYAILKSMVWVRANWGEAGYALATLVDAKTGTESTVTVKTIDGMSAADWNSASDDAVPTYTVAGDYNFSNKAANVSDEPKLNGAYAGVALYRVQTLADGTTVLDGYNGVVGYRHASTITTGATAFVGVSGQPVYVDDNTVFTARVLNADGTYSYKQYVGKNNVPSYADGTARVFYVDLNNDKIVDYVYIKEGTLTNAGNAFVMATQPTYKTMYEGSTQYDVLVNALVGGTATTDGVKATSSNGYVRTLAARVNEPHYVTYGNDGAINAAPVQFSTDAQQASGNTYFVKLMSPYLSGTTLLGMTADGKQVKYSFNTSKLDTAVYGDYTALESVTDWTAVNAYVVYNNATGYATSVYVVNKPATDPGDTPAAMSATIALGNTAKDLTAAVTTVAGAAGSNTNVVLKYRAIGATEWSNYGPMSYTGSTSLSATSAVYNYTNSVTLNGNYEFYAEATVYTVDNSASFTVTSNTVTIYG